MPTKQPVRPQPQNSLLGDTHSAGSVVREETFQLFGRVGFGAKYARGEPRSAELVNERLDLMMATRQPGEIFWLERVSRGEEDRVGSLYDERRYRRDQSPLLHHEGSRRVCAGLRHASLGQKPPRSDRDHRGLLSYIERGLLSYIDPRRRKSPLLHRARSPLLHRPAHVRDLPQHRKGG